MAQSIAELKMKEILSQLSKYPKENANLTPELQLWFLNQFKDTKDIQEVNDSRECSLEDFSWLFFKKIHYHLDIYTRPKASSSIGGDSEVQAKFQTPNTQKNSSFKGKRNFSGASNQNAPNKSFNDSYYLENAQESFGMNSSSVLQKSFNSSYGGGAAGGATNSFDYSCSQSYSMQSSSSTPAKKTPNLSHQAAYQNQQFSSFNSFGSGSHQQHQNQQAAFPQTPQPYHSRRSGNNFNNNAASTPTSGSRQSRNGSGVSGFCLGDFIVTSSPAFNNRMTKKKTSNSQHEGGGGGGGNHQNQEKPKKRAQIKTVHRIVSVTKNSTPAFTSSNANDAANQSFSFNDSIVSEPQEENKSLNVSFCESPIVISSPIAINSPVPAPLVKPPPPSSSVEKESTMDSVGKTDTTMNAVSHEVLLQNLAVIYSLLLDMNLTANILQELGFLLSILNLHHADAIVEPLNPVRSSDSFAEVQEAFRKPANALFFAFCVLFHQKPLLALMDIKSLTAILQIDGIMFSSDLKLFLEETVAYKNQLIRKNNASSNSAFASRASTTSFNTVYFQEEKDSRQCFPSNNDFGAFKAQRDLFYEILKLWENNHLNPTWNFSYNLKAKITEIFRISENLVNMTHFAHLFVSQLLSSALEATTPEEIGLKLDAEKLRHLMQRFIVPSTFSSDYQFPRSLEFFREFILNANSIAFMEHLKLALYVQLTTLNNSSMEQYNLASNDNEYEVNLSSNDRNKEEFIVRSDILASMLILAKFLGFVTAQPYQLVNSQNAEGGFPFLPPSLEKRQIKLRSIFAPAFDVSVILDEAMAKKKLLITLPWLIQYLGMLDNVSLQLEHTSKALKTIFRLYMDLKKMERNSQILPTSAFILRCCIGWLLEKNILISEMYFDFRSNEVSYQKSSHISFITEDGCECLEDSYSKKIIQKLHPSLEKLINVACPFLQEFRVTIKPYFTSKAENSRSVSTKIFDLTKKKPVAVCSAERSEDEKQAQLIKVFLQSQTPSNRTMVEYIIERAFKATVRDAQLMILSPSKSKADDEVNKIESANVDEVLLLIDQIYSKAQKEAFKKWDDFVPKDLEKRIPQALEALLPSETLNIVKDTFLHLIKQESMRKAYQWRHENMEQSSFYYHNLMDMAKKVARLNGKGKPLPKSTELVLSSEAGCVSDLLDELQVWLHCATVRPQSFRGSPALIELLQKFRKESFKHVLPSIYYRILGTYLVELLQKILINHTEHLSKDLIKAACDLWNHPKMFTHHKKRKDSKNVDPVNDEESDNDELGLDGSYPDSNIFHILVTTSFFKTLGNRKECFAKLTELLTALIQENLISFDFINTLLMPIFKEDWSPEVFSLISNMLKTISQEAPAKTLEDCETIEDLNETKSRLLMEVLADFSRDVDCLE